MLIYTGGGFGGSLPDIPARDLSDAEANAFGMERLVASGLYELGTANDHPAPTPSTTRGDIDLRDGVNDAEATLAGGTLAAKKKEK